MRGIAAAFLLVSAAHLDAALASCPDWQPPRVPAIEEARTSDLCKGTPFEPGVEALKRATPEADAKAQAERGGFRLQFMRLSHESCEPLYVRSLQATCVLVPKMTPVDHGKDYQKAFAPLLEGCQGP